ncbi:MAG TPA: hypothetical protein VH912_29435 [Streptosporangiaceae bacterium]|jgi:hypothetical protein
MPAGYLPADNARVFRGVRPTAPECGRLLALADRLLTIAHLALLPHVRPPELTARIVARAAGRLRAGSGHAVDRLTP